MRKRASSRSFARSSKSRKIESQSSNPLLERESAGGLARPRRKRFARTGLFLRTAARLAAAFPRSPSRNAARAFCFAALVFMAFSPNTGENDDRAVINRCRPDARAASCWFENNKVAQWLFLRIIFARVPAEEQDSSCRKTYRAVVDKVSRDDEK
jgi:hypothetical protein